MLCLNRMHKTPENAGNLLKPILLNCIIGKITDNFLTERACLLMKNKLQISASLIPKKLPELLFLCSVVISIFTTYYATGHFLDSDASSELVLARHLLDSGKLFSSDWFYGSELRFLHVQLIYMPLMLLLDDWQMVRYVGALIMHALYIISFASLVHAAGKSKRFFFYGASLLLLPVSVNYGRIVLYHNHYLPNITIAFFLLALTMHFTDTVDWRCRKTWVKLFLLAALSFAGGMNSIRQLMITHTPLLLIAVILCWAEDARSADGEKAALLRPSNLNFLACTLFSAFFSLAGLIAQNILCDKLGLHIAIQSENNLLTFVGFDEIKDILYGYFHQFGYRKNVSMLSISGILSLGGIFIGCYWAVISVKRLLQNSPKQNKRSLLLSGFFAAHLTVMVLLFLITEGPDGYHHPLYLSLCFPWVVPLILNHWEELPTKMHPLHFKKLLAVISVLMLLLSGAVNHAYFQGSDRFPQVYEGLSVQNKDKRADMEEVVTFLMDQGYDKGYASYWNCNIITEMTDGNIPMVLIHDPDSNHSGNLIYHNLLTSLWFQDIPCEKPFLLLRIEGEELFQESDSSVYCTQIFREGKYVAYSIDRLEEFVETLHY